MKRNVRIGELLVSSSTITQDQLKEALRLQAQRGGTIGSNLLLLGALSEEDLFRALREQTDIEYLDLSTVEIVPEVQRLVKLETVRVRRLLPVAMEGAKLVVGLVDPTDLTILPDLEFQSGRKVVPRLLSAEQFSRALSFFEGNGYGKTSLAITRTPEAPGEDLSCEVTMTSLLAKTISLHGQDLHLSAGSIPSVRIDNELMRLDLPPLRPAQVEQMVNSVLTPQQRKSFDEKLELDFAYSVDKVGRFRCNAYRQRNTVAFTARHVSETIPTAEELRLPPFLADFALRTQGLILITGPNGHGKTTTMANMMDVINRSRKANIISIEDPVEYTHNHKLSNVNQREVGTDTFSFAEGLRHIFRQNPDIIVIGELRDFESISIALTAAETGHLVMGTMHALNATAAVDRIIDIFPAVQQNQVRSQLADSLQLVFSQRLLKKASGGGRILAWERMSNSARVGNSIREGRVHQLRSLMQANMEELVSLDCSLADLVVAGEVTHEEAQKFADNPAYFNDLVRVRSTGGRRR